MGNAWKASKYSTAAGGASAEKMTKIPLNIPLPLTLLNGQLQTLFPIYFDINKVSVTDNICDTTRSHKSNSTLPIQTFKTAMRKRILIFCWLQRLLKLIFL